MLATLPPFSPLLISVALNYPGNSHFRALVDRGDEQGIVALIERKIAQGAHGFDLCLAGHPREKELLLELGMLVGFHTEALLFLDSPRLEIQRYLLKEFPRPFVLNSLGSGICFPQEHASYEELGELFTLAQERSCPIVVTLNRYEAENPFPLWLYPVLERSCYPEEWLFWDPLLYPTRIYPDAFSRFSQRCQLLKNQKGRIIAPLANLLLSEPPPLRAQRAQELYPKLLDLKVAAILTPLPLPSSSPATPRGEALLQGKASRR